MEISTQHVDVLIVGGGIVGLTVARAVRDRQPGLDVLVIEKEAEVGTHQTGHNSGVLHSGIYYRPGSLKARLCVEGRRRLAEFCEAEGLPIRRSGKLVVATDRAEVALLEEIGERGVANGVAGIERLGTSGMAAVEPHAAGVAALWVPTTAVVDFAAVARKIAEGLEVLTASEVTGLRADGDGVLAIAGPHRIRTRFVVNAAGLHADRVAALAGESPEVRIVPFRGEYWRLAPEAAGLVNGLIYPVPDPRFPFLGVHFTRGLDGSVEMGPNAVLAWGREQYRGVRPRPGELAASLGSAGFRRLARRHLLSGSGEAVRSVSKALSARRARRMLPELRARHLIRGGAGVRAQAVMPDGRLADDFVITGAGRFLHVLSAPSPAATAALSIGDHLAAEVLMRLRAA